MSSSPATGPSAELIRYAHGSTRIVRTCRPCVTPVLLTTRGSAHRPRSIGCPACMNGNYSSSPEEESATGYPASDRYAGRRGVVLGAAHRSPAETPAMAALARSTDEIATPAVSVWAERTDCREDLIMSTAETQPS